MALCQHKSLKREAKSSTNKKAPAAIASREQLKERTNRVDRRESRPPLTMRAQNPSKARVHRFQEAVQQWDGKARTGPKTGVSGAQDGKHACA